MYLNLVLRKKQAIDKHVPNVSIEQMQKKKKMTKSPNQLLVSTNPKNSLFWYSNILG